MSAANVECRIWTDVEPVAHLLATSAPMGRLAMCIAVVAAGCGRIGYAPIAADAALTNQLLTCPAVASEDTVALYPFDATPDRIARDAAGNHNGTVVGGDAGFVAGPTGCADAIALSGTRYVLVPDSTAFDLLAGSISLWIRVDRTSSRQGILSRDADGNSLPGHATLFLDEGGYLTLRLQQGGGVADAGTFLCSDRPISIGEWTHVGINMGPPAAELYIDGISAAGAVTTIDGMAYACGGTTSQGLAGNDNPLSIGGLSWSSPEGAVEPVMDLLQGAIDQLHIRRLRQDFTVVSAL